MAKARTPQAFLTTCRSNFTRMVVGRQIDLLVKKQCLAFSLSGRLGGGRLALEAGAGGHKEDKVSAIGHLETLHSLCEMESLHWGTSRL